MKRMEGLHGAQPCLAAHRIVITQSSLAAPFIAALLAGGGAWAQAVPTPTPQFDITGFIQSATVDPTMCPLQTDPFLKGGTVTVNGLKMVVPCNTIIQMPANTIPWALLFPQTDASGTIIGSAASPIGPVGGVAPPSLNGQIGGISPGQAPGATGLALADSFNALGVPTTTGPFPSFEIRAVGNVVKLPDIAGVLHDSYVIGLIVPVTQQGANLGSGLVTCIDYANGYLVVGGDPSAAPNTAPGAPPCTMAGGAVNGSRVQLNDPIGRWGTTHSPDPRFSGDTNNTTVHSQSGYPMCVPRVVPTSVGVGDGGDPQCPAGNRPLNGLRTAETDPTTGLALFPLDPYLPTGVNAAALKVFTMPPPPQPLEPTPSTGTCLPVPDATCVPAIPAAPPQYPDSRFQVPFVVGDYIDYAGTVGKDALGQTYISAHTVTAHLGIYTAAGTLPSYIAVETILLGSGGTPVSAVQIEPTTRIFIVGFTTDPTNFVDINAIDVDPCTGAETLRRLGTVDPRTQVVHGRFRFHVLGGKFMPPTREMLIVHHNGQNDATPPFDPAQAGQLVGVANGLGAGSYRLPNFDFIFPENIKFGEPTVANNFLDFPFLAQGSGPLFGAAGNAIVGQLTPWPGTPTPAAVTCVTNAGGLTGAAPLVDAGFSFAINDTSAGVEPIVGTLNQDPRGGIPTNVAWTQTSGPAVTFSAATLSPALDGSNTILVTGDFRVVDPLTLAVAPSAGAALGVGASISFTLTATDAFGTSTSLPATVTVKPTTDTVAGIAVWRAPRPGVRKAINKVGTKGGLVQITGTESITDPTIQVIAPGWGAMEVSPVLGLPTYIIKVTGTDAPTSAIVRTSLGAEALNIPVRLR